MRASSPFNSSSRSSLAGASATGPLPSVTSTRRTLCPCPSTARSGGGPASLRFGSAAGSSRLPSTTRSTPAAWAAGSSACAAGKALEPRGCSKRTTMLAPCSRRLGGRGGAGCEEKLARVHERQVRSRLAELGAERARARQAASLVWRAAAGDELARDRGGEEQRQPIRRRALGLPRRLGLRRGRLRGGASHRHRDEEHPHGAELLPERRGGEQTEISSGPCRRQRPPIEACPMSVGALSQEAPFAARAQPRAGAPSAEGAVVSVRLGPLPLPNPYFLA